MKFVRREVFDTYIGRGGSLSGGRYLLVASDGYFERQKLGDGKKGGWTWRVFYGPFNLILLII